MTTCETCKHWLDVDGKKPDWANCNKLWKPNGYKQKPEDKVILHTIDMDECAFLITSKDFGCNLYEEKA